MKFAKLLVLNALWLGMAGSAMADVPDGVWTIPDPSGALTYTDYTVDTYERAYLYNPASKMFFASGNEWSTRAGIASFGYEVWFVTSTEEDAPEGSVEFWDNCQHPDRTLGDQNIFTDDGGSSWVDHGSQGNYSWAVTKVGEFYRFQNVALIADLPDYDGKYLGWKGSYGDTRLYMITPEEGSVDWKFVTAESYLAFKESDAYTAYANGVECYNVAQELKKVLEEAQEIGAQVDAELAVYLNTNSTLAELQAAITSAKAAIEKRKTELVDENYDNATVANPVDVTDKFIKNPHFDNGDCTTGWEGTAFGRGGTVADGAEHYSKNYETYQSVSGLKPGVYAIGVNAFYRSGNYNGDAENHFVANDEASRYAKLYGKVGDFYMETSIANVLSGGQSENQGQGDAEVTFQDADGNDVVLYVPNTMKTGDYYFHTLNQYANKLIVAIDEAGELTIGVKKTEQISGDWSLFDDFSLTYYGKGADAAQVYMDEALKNFAEYTPGEDVIYTEAYLTAYNDLINGEHNPSSLDAVTAEINAISDAYNALQTNISLWKQYQEIWQKASSTVGDSRYWDLISAQDLADYLDENEEVVEDHVLNNEEIEAAIAEIQKMIDDVMAEYANQMEPGTDVTDRLINPDFEFGLSGGKAEGWTVDVTNNPENGNITPGPLGTENDQLMIDAMGKTNHCFEAWHVWGFDVWQEVTNMPAGVYQIQAQGYVRGEFSGYTRGDEIDPNTIPVKLYMNSFQSNFPSVYSEQIPEDKFDPETGSLPSIESWSWETINGNQYPNSMGGASLCFAWDMYTVNTFGLVQNGETMRIGVKGDMKDNWWCIWDNFKVIYQGFDAAIVETALDAALLNIDLSKPMGKSVYEKAAALKAEADEAKASQDGRAMYNLIVKVNKIFDEIQTSVALFKKLNDANEDFMNVISYYYDSAYANEAMNLAGEISEGIENHAFEDADVDIYLQKIAAMKTKLRLPAGADKASDDNPINVTAVIDTPNYDEDGANSIAGWTASGYNFGNDDTQKSALAIEFYNKTFDTYQTIVGLPEGIYEVSVYGFSRNGSIDQDFASFAESQNYSLALVYTVDGDSTVNSVPVAPLAKGALANDDPGISGEASTVVNEVTYYFPNDMVSARAFFDMGSYKNTLVTKVLADGKLTIGMKKTENKDTGWVLLDEWTLTYFGNASSKQPSGDASGIENAAMPQQVRVEYFTLDGRKASSMQRGIMIQKVTFDNGNVIVNKIRR